MNQEKGQMKLVKGEGTADCNVAGDLNNVSFLVRRDSQKTSFGNSSLLRLKEATPDSVIPDQEYAGVVIINTADERPPIVILTDDEDISQLIEEIQDQSTSKIAIHDIHGMFISLDKDFISMVEIPYSYNRIMALGVQTKYNPEFPDEPDFALVIDRYCDGIAEQRTSEGITRRAMKLESWKRRCRKRRCLFEN
jgi:hypothetical protein